MHAPHVPGVAVADGGKTLAESDPEVSEAVDFLEFYRRSAAELARLPGLRARGKGVVAVVSPWNFPIAIPCGGVAAALSAGNNVILKPASDAVGVAFELCRCLWRAGVPERALQFLPCSGAAVGSRLVTHPDVDVVILTGGTDTALEQNRGRLRDGRRHRHGDHRHAHHITNEHRTGDHVRIPVHLAIATQHPTHRQQ